MGLSASARTRHRSVPQGSAPSTRFKGSADHQQAAEPTQGTDRSECQLHFRPSAALRRAGLRAGNAAVAVLRFRASKARAHPPTSHRHALTFAGRATATEGRADVR